MHKVINDITRILKKSIKFIAPLLLTTDRVKNEIKIEAINEININKSLLLVLDI
jgi:hypothetical protein